MMFDILSRLPGGWFRLLAVIALSVVFTHPAASAAPAQQPYLSKPETVDDTTPPVATVSPLPPFTMSSTFTVNWSGTDNESGIAYYDVEYQTNGGQWKPFKSATTETSGLFTDVRQGTTYGFRARAVDNAGNVQPWAAAAQATTTVSVGDPAARVVAFDNPITKNDTFNVEWTGSAPPGASVVSFDIQYNFNGGNWVDWLLGVNVTTDQFTAEEGDGVYGFRARARDNAGRTGPYSALPDAVIAVDAVAPPITIKGYLPVLFGE